MYKLIISQTATALLFLTFQSFFQQNTKDSFIENKYAKLTEVNVQIVDNRNVINDANLLVMDNHTASLVFSHAKTGMPVSRIFVTTKKDHSEGKELITIDAEYFTFQKNDWVSKSSPTIINKSGSKGVASIISDSNKLDIAITAISMDNEILLSDPILNHISTCNSQQKCQRLLYFKM